MKHTIIILTAMLAASSAFAKTTVNYFSFTTDAPHVATLNTLIATFQQQNPDIEVKVTTAPFDSYFTKLQTQIAAGQAPDVFELNYENFVTFASKGILSDLNAQMKADKTLKPGTFYPAAQNAFRYQGKQLGLPITFSTVVLFYNKTLFDKAGVTYPTSAWTWKDVTDAAKKLSDPAKKVWGIYQPVQFWEFYKVAKQAGGGLNVTANGVQIDSPANRRALHYLVDKILVDKIQPSEAQLSGMDNSDLFLNGQLGMLVSGIWMFSKFAPATFTWDIAVEPGGVRKATHFFSNSAVVSAASKSQDAAYKWVKFLAVAPETVKARIDTSWDLPALSLSQRAQLQSYLAKPQPANREVVFESLRSAINPPVVANQSQLQDIINQELQAASLGTKTVEQALASAQARAKGIK